MKMFFRVTASLLVMAGCFAAVAAFQPNSPARWDKQSVGPSMEPGEVSLIVQERMNAKNKIVARLAAGELNLLEAAAWFRYLNDNPPEHTCEYRKYWKGGSDGEKLCRQVMAWVHSGLHGRMPQSQVDAFISRLQGELDGILAEHGTVELPW